MKFLLKYKQVFEASKRIEGEEKRAEEAKKLYQDLKNERLRVGKAMSAIVALKKEYDIHAGAGYADVPKETKSGTTIPDPSGAFVVYNKPQKGLYISFKMNYTPYFSNIYCKDGKYFFETAEQTATYVGKKDETTEEKVAREAAMKGFFRFLNREDSKNQFKKETKKNIEQDLLNNLRVLQNRLKSSKEEEKDLIRTQIEELKIKIEQGESEEERSARLERNAEIEAKRLQAYNAGNWKSVSPRRGDYQIVQEFDDLGDCLMWAWAYFITRKTPRVLDKEKTFVYLIKNFETLKNKKIPLGDRYGSEDAEVKGTIVEDLEKEETLLSGISVKRETGLVSMYAEELQDMRSTAYFIKAIYELLGLEVKPKSEVGGEKTVSRPDLIIGFDISNNLSNSNTVLGAACKSFTNSPVKYMDRDLIFELAPRSEFKKIGKDKIYTKMDDSTVQVYFSCRQEEEAFRKLLLGFKLQAAGVKAEDIKPIILSSFSGESKEIMIVGELGVEKIKNSFILGLIIDYTKNIAKNIEEFIPGIKSRGRGKSFEIPNIESNDPKILKILADTIDTGSRTIGKSLSIKQSLKDNSIELYNKLVGAGMTPLKEVAAPSPTQTTRTRTRPS